MGLISLMFISIPCTDQIVELTAQFDSLDCLQKKKNLILCALLAFQI